MHSIQENKQIAVLYHAQCADGFGAAWSAWKELGDSADYIPVKYGDEPPDVEKYTEIYVLDFSYAPVIMDVWRYDGTQRKVITLDHHKSAEEMLKGYPGAIFDMTHSGAYLAWQYFHPRDNVPQLIRYIQDRDLWFWKLPYSREISAALWSYPMEFEIWNEIALILDDERKDVSQSTADHYNKTLVREGAAILRHTQKEVEMIASQAYLEKLGDYTIPVVNATSLWSEVCEELIRLYPEAEFVGCWHETKDHHLKWSLRSKGEFDVSEVAKMFDGGGHKNAAGFIL